MTCKVSYDLEAAWSCLYTTKAIIGQALADYLVDHQIPDDWELNDDLSGEDMFLIVILTPCEMYLDGA